MDRVCNLDVGYVSGAGVLDGEGDGCFTELANGMGDLVIVSAVWIVGAGGARVMVGLGEV